MKKINIEKKIYVLFFIALIFWLIYFFMFYNYYNDAIDMVTVGAKRDIQILELFYYRGRETVTILSAYFFILSLHILFIVYIKLRSIFENGLKKIYLLNIVVLIIMLIASYINLFWILFLILTLASCTLNFIIYSISKAKYNYIDGEIVFEKGGIGDRETAENLLKEYIETKSSYFAKKDLVLSGEVINEPDKTYKIELVVEEKE